MPSFRQGDERWRDDPLGGVSENGTMGEAGCAVAAAAMVFEFYGIETDPQQLNWFLTSVGGYTDQGWLYWDRAAWWAPDRVRHIYEDLPSYDLIDSNLAHGNPVIVRVRFSNGITHFVVIAGKDGFDYLIRDPGAGAAKGYYPLRELGSDIEALRFYKPVTGCPLCFWSDRAELRPYRCQDAQEHTPSETWSLKESCFRELSYPTLGKLAR